MQQRASFTHIRSSFAREVLHFIRESTLGSFNYTMILYTCIGKYELQIDIQLASKNLEWAKIEMVHPKIMHIEKSQFLFSQFQGTHNTKPTWPHPQMHLTWAIQSGCA